ncbi:hypothetical protein EF294_08210 [Gordonia oryzae]|uniref:Low molecular weight antigen MTB12-like C-terminal domain-containing protein n=1 Tax=Gordonia oryzae TaxID=2487349 RepID=A0A3N4GKQ0_9ACTN|nr:hypothetical protein EF294_08210 [Gordonia oryzae]
MGAVMITAAVTVSVAACSSGDSSDDIPTVAQTTTSSAASTAGGGTNVTDASNPPSVATLNQMLQTALDPNVPNAQKTQLVQNSQKDPSIFNRLVKLKSDNPGASYQIRGPVTTDGPNRASVRVQVKLPDQQPQDIDAQIVYDGGRWKLASSFVCPLITSNGVTTPMCPSSTSTRPSS